jgi:hypothetical protein
MGFRIHFLKPFFDLNHSFRWLFAILTNFKFSYGFSGVAIPVSSGLRPNLSICFREHLDSPCFLAMALTAACLSFCRAHF